MRDFTDLFQTVETYMQEKVEHQAHYYEEEHKFPAEFFHDLVDLGIFELLLHPNGSEEVQAFYEIVRIVSKTFAALASTIMAQGIYGISTFYLLGTEQQKRQYLPAMVSGRHIACFAINEPSSSRLGYLQTKITPAGNKYVITGDKETISNSPIANTFILVGKAEEGFGLVAVDLPNDQLTISKALDKMGVHALPVGNIAIDDLKFSHDQLVGEQFYQESDIDRVMRRIRIATAYQAIGITEGALEQGLTHARKRRNTGKRLIDLDSFQNNYTRLLARLDAGEVYLRDVSKNYPEDPSKTSKAKLYTSQLAVDTTRELIDIIGGVAYFTNGEIERYYRDAVVTTLYGGSIETQQEIMMKPYMD